MLVTTGTDIPYSVYVFKTASRIKKNLGQYHSQNF